MAEETRAVDRLSAGRASAQTITTTDNAVRVDHPDGGCTVVVKHPEWTATVILEPSIVKWWRDRRRGGGSYGR